LENYVDSHITYNLSSKGSKQSTSDYNNQIATEKAQQRSDYKQSLYNDTQNTVDKWNAASAANANKVTQAHNSATNALTTTANTTIQQKQTAVLASLLQAAASSGARIPTDRWQNQGYQGSGRLDSQGSGTITAQDVNGELIARTGTVVTPINSKVPASSSDMTAINAAGVSNSYATLHSSYIAKRRAQNQAAGLPDDSASSLGGSGTDYASMQAAYRAKRASQAAAAKQQTGMDDPNPSGGLDFTTSEIKSTAQDRGAIQGSPMPAGWTQEVNQ
jgi:hypothetical protein